MTIELDGFGELIELAEANGFDADTLEREMMEESGISPSSLPTPNIIDALEEAAIEHLAQVGIDVSYL